MSLYNKYRPQTLEQVKGNEQVIMTLQGMLKNKKDFPHTILLHGGTGCGKTTIARILSKELGCSGHDYSEINSADFRGIDTVREMIKSSTFCAMEGSVRVYVLDEIHKMTGDAQNALLKLLEDPPKHVYFFLCTTEPQKLLPTIKGRCSQYQVNPLNEQQMYQLLRRIARSEGVSELDQQIYDQIIQDSLGHPRNAIQILEQVLNAPEDKRLSIAQKAAAEQSQVIELCRALFKREKWDKVKVILEGLKGQDAETIRRAVLGYMVSILLKSSNDHAAFIIEEFKEPTYDNGFNDIVYASYSVINK